MKKLTKLLAYGAVGVALVSPVIVLSNISTSERESEEVRRQTFVNNISDRSKIELGKNYYVTSYTLSVRKEDDSTSGRKGSLSRNNTVRVVDASPELGEDYVEIEVVQSWNGFSKLQRGYVSYKHLAPEKLYYQNYDSKYFIIQNVATERMRIYEKQCNDQEVCNHKMVMEAELAVGEKSEETETYVGSYRVTDWVKFYQDGAKHYPSWYDPTYPEVPDAGSSFFSWFKNKRMPNVYIGGKKKKPGVMRGAFGWYTAQVGPNHNYQWTHGTIGWGKDKDKFIKQTKTSKSNIFANPRSSGCSRTNNEAIAYMRHLISRGTPLVKIYAKEALMDQDRRSYRKRSKKWDYILTSRGVRTDGQRADRYEVLGSGIGREEILEKGTYTVDMFPNIVYYTPAKKLWFGMQKIGDSGNAYKVKEKMMRGLFYVDTGLISKDYKHPIYAKQSLFKSKDIGVKRGGFKSEIAPAYMFVKAGNNTNNSSIEDREVKRTSRQSLVKDDATKLAEEAEEERIEAEEDRLEALEDDKKAKAKLEKKAEKARKKKEKKARKAEKKRLKKIAKAEKERLEDLEEAAEKARKKKEKKESDDDKKSWFSWGSDS